MPEAEYEKVIEAFNRCRGNRQILKEEADVVIDWVLQTTTNYSLLENILAGTISIDVSDGDAVFRTTSDGEERVKQLMTEEGVNISKGEYKDTADKGAESWPAPSSLAGRILKLLYVWDSS